MRAIELRGARTHNLRGLDLDLQPGSLIVITGPSGAGKSSLAFGTLYAEGQRRYVESFSAYARQFLERLARPPVDRLEPVPAAIAVDRGAPVKTSRSTVATMTEISDYARQLWALLARPRCPACGSEVVQHDPGSAADALLDRLAGERVVVTYAEPVADVERFLELRERLLGAGYGRVWIDGATVELSALRPSQVLDAAGSDARLDVVIDRLTARASDRGRIVDALEAAFARGHDEAAVHGASGSRLELTRALSCTRCATRVARLPAGAFSYNSPLGACERCRGFGRTIAVDWDKVIPDHDKSLKDGAIKPWATGMSRREMGALRKHCERAGIPMDVPFAGLSPEAVRSILDGDGKARGFYGIAAWFRWLERKAYKMHVRVLLSRYRKYVECEDCGGSRLRPAVRDWRVAGVSLPEFYARPVNEALALVSGLRGSRELPAVESGLDTVITELSGRLQLLCDVGLGYLTAERSARELSGGELQRVALTSALGSSLTGTLFVLDEPSVGLHPADVVKLESVVRRLAHADNVVLVVESEPAFVRGADRVLELGPGAGSDGGSVVFDGPPAELLQRDTATARRLRGQGALGGLRREPTGWLTLEGATGHNLHDVTLRIPLGVLSCVTGVSGSGKSTLIGETLVPALLRARKREAALPLPYRALSGHEALGEALYVDQAPLGRTSRGNPATYLGVWDRFRKHLAAQPLAREREYTPGFFSFNVAGGRCEACKGEGSETVEMQFLADVQFSCPECGGRRFVGEVLDVKLAGKDAAELLELTADEALALFADFADVKKVLAPLIEVGAGYLKLGQPLSTLSGGEAQRLKLAAALGSVEPRSFIVLDEPTAGLHAQDVAPLRAVLQQLVDAGHTVVLVEHDMELAGIADHVIDLGPGAGVDGGQIVVEGSPETVAAHAESRTAPFLARALSGRGEVPKPREDRRAVHAVDHVDAMCVYGATEHNLQRVSVEIPREKLVVITGPSGSGKSTLAFDVLFAEAQRRYLETLSPYVRQYLKQLPRPAVERVTGTPPAVSLEQRATSGARNSTVATLTEVAHHLRLLFARAGVLSCPDCGFEIAPRSADTIARDIRQGFGKREVTLLAPAVRGQKGAHREKLARARRDGITRARIDGKLQPLVAGLKLDRYAEHDVELMVGSVRADSAELTTLLRRTLMLGEGSVCITAGSEQRMFSERRACPGCGRGFPELDPRFFSFNTRQGACARCEGAGEVDAGARSRDERVVCPECDGTRLSGLALHTRVAGAGIREVFALDVSAAREALKRIRLDGREAEVGRLPLAEARVRLEFLERVGLGYLGLDRAAASLSGGELQRVRLAAQLGSGLTGLLYVLDEPTIGLHPHDTGRLLAAIRELVDKGCSVLVVEHDSDTILAADHVVDVGPGGGRLGGRVLASGTPRELMSNPESVTGAALARPAVRPAKRRPLQGVPELVVSGVTAHNLKDVELAIPHGRLTVVTGVSGSGKSTLVREVLLRAVSQKLGLETPAPGAFSKLSGVGNLKRAVEIDQSPIGRTPRSVPGTYVGVWDELRKLYAALPEARARGYGPSRFSFNVAEGRCPECEGQGALSMEMSFLPTALVPCERCGGRRFNEQTESVRLMGKGPGELLDLDIADVARLLAAFPKVKGRLELLVDLGLGYLKLGQPSNTLSGGEAQRLKLATELGLGGGGATLYVMDEPTTGLHRDDVTRVLAVIERLVERGDTVVVIEHHPDVMLAADLIVDLGPEGGSGGGRVVARGTPEAVMKVKKSHTGAALRALVGG